MGDELLNAADIAREAGVHRATIGDWIAKRGIVPAQTNQVKRKLYRRADVQPLIDEAQAKRAKAGASNEVPPPPASVN